jgi:CubicO group peptidase (beta-lactamase class C family)
MNPSLSAKTAILALTLATRLSSLAADRSDFPNAANVLEQALEAKAFPGCSVAVGNSEEMIWCDAFGQFDYDDGPRVKRNTIYDLASLTKVSATTATYMRLVALGKIRVTDPVADYLPELLSAAPTDAEKRTREKITIEHLLTHSSGLTGWKPFYREVSSHEAMIDKIVSSPLEAAPGTRVRYSDPGMMLLGEIASRCGAQKLPDLATELVFRPLHMDDTMFNPPKKLLGRIPPTETWPGTNTFVHGVVHDENARAAEGITGHAGLFSTAEDLSKLAQEILRGLDGKSKLFPSDVVADFVRERKDGRGLGWGVGKTEHPDGKTTRYISHTGFTGTSIRVDLDKKVYIILLSNRVHPSRDNDKVGRVRSRLAEAVMEDLELQ